MDNGKYRGLIILLSAIGIAIAVYLTIYHYDSNLPLLCPSSISVVNCEQVLNSQYSIFFGIPMPVMGLIFFAIELLLLLFAKNKDYLVIFNAFGVAFVVYLIYLESIIGKICLFCTTIHILVLLLFVLSILRMRESSTSS